MKKRVLSVLLALVMLLGLLPVGAWAASSTVTIDNVTYTTDEHGRMAYKTDWIDVQGKPEGHLYWIQTTFKSPNTGFTGYQCADTSSGSVTQSADFINDGRYIRISHTLKAPRDEAITNEKLSVYANIQIGDNNAADVETIRDAAGKVIGLKMVDNHTQTGCTSRGAQFNLYFDGTGGVTPADTYWFGDYNASALSNYY